MPSVTNYTGNAGLGLGANSDVPAVSTKDLDIISQTADRLQAQNAYQNHAIFAQKIKDRDQLMAAIDSGDVKVGDILEEDMDWVKEGLGALDGKFLERVKAGTKYGMGSNEFIDADREYTKAKREAQDRTTQAGTRFLGDKAQAAAIATETLPHKREAMIKNNQEWKKNKWGEVKPYQQTLDADFDIIKKYPKKVETERPDPKNPLMKIKETTVSVPATFQEADKDFKEGGKEMYNQMELLKQYQSMRPDELGAWLTAANNRLRPHNAEIKFLVDKETGEVIIEESIPNFSAKWSMATDPQLSASTSEVDKGALDIAKFKLDEKELASIDRDRRGRLGLDWTKFNYAKDEDIDGASSVINEARDIISKGVEVTTEGPGGKKVLRIGDPTLLKTFGNIDRDGNVSNVPDAIEYDKKTDQVKLIYYDGKTSSGKNIISKEVALDQRTWLKEIGKRSFPNKDLGTVNTLVDDILTKNGNSLFKLTQKTSAETYNINGKSYSKQDLLDGGWTEKQIAEAQKAGKLK